jgi:UDP-N-acetylglucosamine--N-acetylmuramyl-(pentapeptide) pyrophosphoryl-undecaprenol N-acetylglucosamine transferase
MNSQRRKLRVIISGGGTGGHIFPAVAIANRLMKENPETEILFVGANGRMEMDKVPAAGYRIEGLDISGLQRKLSPQNLLLPVKIIKSVMKSRQIIKSFRPDVAIGVGGYASGPLLYAATMMKIPSLIQEQNSFAGITNKLLGHRVHKICVAYTGMGKFFPEDKVVMTGNPVREETVNISGKRDEAFRFFSLDPNKKTILVTGGSLGARTINDSIGAILAQLKLNDIQLIWQTGKLFAERAKAAIKFHEAPGMVAFDFINRMDLAYAAADVVVARAGASSVSELTLVAKPAILVPSPNVAEDHQTKNAKALTDKNAAILVSDEECRYNLLNVLLTLLKDESRMESLKTNISKLALHDSAGKIVDEVYKIIN